MAYSKAAALHPYFRAPNPDHVEALLGAGRYDEARSRLEAMLRGYPGNPFANAQMGMLLLATGDTSGARSHLRRAAETWNEADPEFQEAAHVRTALAAIQM